MEPDPHTPVEETLKAMDDLVRAGKVRFIGASNIDARQLREALATSSRLGLPRYESVQNGYSLLDRAIEAEVLPLAAKEPLAVTPFGPTSGGLLTGKYRYGEPATPGSRMALRPQPYRELLNERTFRSIDALRAAAGERGVDMGTLALAWVLNQPRVTSALVGPRTVEHFARWLEAVEVRLTPADREELVSRMEGVPA
jgi:aryl-alcohol dehydrogenase-like predicted oxidoreductase